MSTNTSPETTKLPPRPSTLPYAYSAVVDDAPLPAVGDFWAVDNHDLSPVAVPPAYVARRVVVAPPYVPVYPRATTTAPLARWSLATALASVPLVAVFGIGAVLGIVAVLLGIGGIAQATSNDHYRGAAKATTSIVIGMLSTIVGIPLMLLTMAVIDFVS